MSDLNEMNYEVVKVEKKAVQDKDRLNIAVIGLGNAGGQNAYCAFKEGFPAIALNTSEKDLRDEVLKEIPAIIVGDGRGAAKDRTIAKEFLKENLNAIFSHNTFTDITESADIIVLVSSLGGGSGAGFLALMGNRLQVKYPAATVICFGIAPKLSEAGQAHMNKIEVIDELNKLKLPFTILDLSQVEDLPNEKAFDVISKQFIQDLKIIRGDYSKLTTTGMIDAREWLTLFNTPGYFTTASVTNLSDRDITKQSVQCRLIEQLENNNCHAKINNDKFVKYLGVTANFTDSVEDPMKAGNFNELNAHLGRPVDSFNNLGNGVSSTEAHIVATGLSVPGQTIDASKNILMEYSLVNKKSVDLSHDREEINFFKDSNSRDKGKLLGKGSSHINDMMDDIPDFL